MKMFIKLTFMFIVFMFIFYFLFQNYKENEKKMIRVLVLITSVFVIPYFGNMDYPRCLFVFCASFLITIAYDYVFNKLFLYYEGEKSIKDLGKLVKDLGKFVIVSGIVGVLLFRWFVDFAGYGAIPLLDGSIVMAVMGGYVGSQFNWIKFK